MLACFCFLCVFAACDFSKCPWKQLTKVWNQIPVWKNQPEEAVLEISLDLAFPVLQDPEIICWWPHLEVCLFAPGLLLS